MARNSNTSNTTSTKRKFGVSTKNIPTSIPTIPDGIYKGNLKFVKADADDKQFAKFREIEDLQLFDVIEVVTGKKDARVHTGEYTITGALTYMVELQNTEDQVLPMDTMSIGGGRVNIFFAKDEDGNWGLDNSADQFGVRNRTFMAFKNAIGLTDDELEAMIDDVVFDYDEEFPVPERLSEVEGVQEMLQACAFYKSYFNLIAQRANGTEVKVNISRVTRNEGDDPINQINTGNFNSSCGLLPIE